MCECVCTYIVVCMLHTYISTFIHIHIYTYICVCVCVYTYTYVGVNLRYILSLYRYIYGTVRINTYKYFTVSETGAVLCARRRGFRSRERVRARMNRAESTHLPISLYIYLLPYIYTNMYLTVSEAGAVLCGRRRGFRSRERVRARIDR